MLRLTWPAPYVAPRRGLRHAARRPVGGRLETVDLRSFGCRPSSTASSRMSCWPYPALTGETRLKCHRESPRHAGPRVSPFWGVIDAPVAPPHRQCQRRPLQRLASGSGHPQLPRPRGTWGSVPARVTDLAASRCSLSARTANMETLRTATERPDLVTTT